jgi:hypothetical protein
VKNPRKRTWVLSWPEIYGIFMCNQIHINSWGNGLELLHNGLGRCFKVWDICLGIGTFVLRCETWEYGDLNYGDPKTNCLVVGFLIFLRVAHSYVWHGTMHIPSIISRAILTVTLETCHQSW